jgi:mono/diheme cytochrome c family protein
MLSTRTAVMWLSVLWWSGQPAMSNAVDRTSDQGSITAEKGRTIFNGIGRCSTCHGIDGDRKHLPEDLSANIRENVAGMNPPPADLRNPAALILSTDKERFDIIRHGRLRSAMHPISETTLEDKDLLSLLAYLATLRGTQAQRAGKMAGSSAGNLASGQRLYHELGGCSICHGLHGNPKKLPEVSPKLREELARLQPPPTDLRNAAALKSDDDLQRFLTIKYGHPATAMFAKPLLRDEDIWDLIAYVKSLAKTKPVK